MTSDRQSVQLLNLLSEQNHFEVIEVIISVTILILLLTLHTITIVDDDMI
jgi:hypothetical protein